MSVQTLYTAATGMTSLQTKLDTIANNLANTETTSYKRARANFEDLFYQNQKLPGSEDSAGQLTPTGIAIGLGTRVSSIQTDFKQGAFKSTGNSLDLAIEGRGFFQVLQIAGVGHGVQHEDVVIRVLLQHVPDEIRADEPGPACY